MTYLGKVNVAKENMITAEVSNIRARVYNRKVSGLYRMLDTIGYWS